MHHHPITITGGKGFQSKTGLREGLQKTITGVVIRTASRDLEDLVKKEVLRKVGATGRNTHYILAQKLDTNRTNRT